MNSDLRFQTVPDIDLVLRHLSIPNGEYSPYLRVCSEHGQNPNMALSRSNLATSTSSAMRNLSGKKRARLSPQERVQVQEDRRASIEKQQERSSLERLCDDTIDEFDSAREAIKSLLTENRTLFDTYSGSSKK